MHLSEQELVRRENLKKMRELGIEPYPAEAFPVNAYAVEIQQGLIINAEIGRAHV